MRDSLNPDRSGLDPSKLGCKMYSLATSNKKNQTIFRLENIE